LISGEEEGAVRWIHCLRARHALPFESMMTFWTGFGNRSARQVGGSYQTMINGVLREYMMRQQEPLELILRRVVREELANYTVNQAGEQTSND
jgi:hypothetical protein